MESARRRLPGLRVAICTADALRTGIGCAHSLGIHHLAGGSYHRQFGVHGLFWGGLNLPSTLSHKLAQGSLNGTHIWGRFKVYGNFGRFAFNSALFGLVIFWPLQSVRHGGPTLSGSSLRRTTQ